MNNRAALSHPYLPASRQHLLRWGALPVFLLLGVLLLAGCANPSSGLVAAARVNGQAISLEQYLRFVQINKSLCQFQNELTGQIRAPIDWNDPARRADLAAVRRQSLDQLINAELTSEQAEKYHIPPPDEQQVDQLLSASQQAGRFPPNSLLASLHVSQDDLRLLARQAIEQQTLLRLLPNVKVTEAHVASIAVSDRATAELVLAQLQNGVAFDTLAGQYSQDRTRGTGGDAGYFTPGTAPEALDQVYFQAPVGQVVGPVVVVRPADRLCFANVPGDEPSLSTQQGPATYYVVKVLSRQTVSLYDVPNALNAAQDVPFARWLRQGADIQVLVDF